MCDSTCHDASAVSASSRNFGLSARFEICRSEESNIVDNSLGGKVQKSFPSLEVRNNLNILENLIFKVRKTCLHH